MRLYGVPVPGYVDSTNWGGYAVTGSGFTKALGSWIVPTANCTKTPNTYSSYWLGLDGIPTRPWNKSEPRQTVTARVPAITLGTSSTRTPLY